MPTPIHPSVLSTHSFTPCLLSPLILVEKYHLHGNQNTAVAVFTTLGILLNFVSF